MALVFFEVSTTDLDNSQRNQCLWINWTQISLC